MNMETSRRKTTPVRLGETGIVLGADHPIAIQSMTNTDTHNTEATLAQVKALERAGCEIVRITAPDEASASIFTAAKDAGITIPLVADIHFDYKIALACVRSGVSKIRINPGNIGEEWKIREVADACRAAGIPIRIGVNSGSLEKKILEKYGHPGAEALAESALYNAELLEKFGFSDIVVSIKSSTVQTMIEANRILAKACNYPIHLGVTEAGGERMGTVKSAIGIGALLADGIGDTIRVSLTADPVREIAAAQDILSALGLGRKGGIQIVSCPTCGRTKISLIDLLGELEAACADIETNGKKLTVALMGCAVNGPGEAREADIGAAGGNGEALLFCKGEIIGKVSEEEIISALVAKIREILAQK